MFYFLICFDPEEISKENEKITKSKLSLSTKEDSTDKYFYEHRATSEGTETKPIFCSTLLVFSLFPFRFGFGGQAFFFVCLLLFGSKALFVCLFLSFLFMGPCHVC